MPKSKQVFKELLKPGRIGHMELRNRIAMAPMGTYLAGRDGMITDRMKSYYEARAKGGAGLIIAEVFSVDYPRGRVMTRQAGISDDKFIPGLAELAGIIHRHGAKMGIQLQHGGRIAAPFLSGGHEPVSASVIPLVPKELGVTRELSIPEITQLVECFARAAERVRKAGIDGVEIHAGHGYLIDQFLSRSTNKRQDIYGGSLQNRARFLLEIIQAVREQVGPDYPVWCRIDGREFAIEDGITREEAQEIAGLIEKAGADAIHVSGYGGSQGLHFTEAPLVNNPGYLLPLASDIKRKVNIPVIAAGRISLESAEKVLLNGEADVIAMGRPLLADPELPHKVAAGTVSDIRKCIYCYSCVHQIFVRSNVCCAINPLVGKESELITKPAEKAKKVLVVGGGPAGLAAAIQAASRGHEVMLYEKEKYLGGSLRFAAIVRPENQDLIQYLDHQIKKLKIQLELNAEVSPDLVGKLKPDVLILATGAKRNNPSITGINSRNVINGDDLRKMLSGSQEKAMASKLTGLQKMILYPARFILNPTIHPSILRNLTRIWMPLGNNIAILGGGIVACELAVFLGERGRRVTILDNNEQIGTDMALPFKWIIEDKLEKNKVTVITEVKCEEITSRSIVFLKNGEKQTIRVDNIIVATSAEPDNDLFSIFKDKAAETYLAGDCTKIGYIKDSISEGFRIASFI